jgi:ribosome-associated protein
MSQGYQAANREGALARFIELVRNTLVVAPERRATRPTRQGRERRLAGKKHRSKLKAERAARASWEQ